MKAAILTRMWGRDCTSNVVGNARSDRGAPDCSSVYRLAASKCVYRIRLNFVGRADRHGGGEMTESIVFRLISEVEAREELAATASSIEAMLEAVSVINKLAGALVGLVPFFRSPGVDELEHFETLAAIFHNETGYLRPGKDCVVHDPETRRKAWDEWVEAKIKASYDALLTKARGAAA